VAGGTTDPSASKVGGAAAQAILDAWGRCTEGLTSPSRVPIRIDLPAGGGPASFAPLGGAPPDWGWCVVGAVPRAELEAAGVPAAVFVPPG
jgi:hypothetical protein